MSTSRRALPGCSLAASPARLDTRRREGRRALLRLLRDAKLVGRHLFVDALGEAGPVAKEAIPAIEAGLTATADPKATLEQKATLEGQAIMMRLAAARA